MRHRVYGSKFSRNKNERNALFKSLVQSLLNYGTIETSETKAKAIKGMTDKIINLAKNKNSQRLIQSYLTNKKVGERLIKEIVPKMQNRVSGYTSMVRLGTRLGDNSMMVRMSLIGAEKMEPIEKVTVEKKLVTGKKTGDIGQSVKKTQSAKRITKRSTLRSSKTK